jgi:hypothetical protein
MLLKILLSEEYSKMSLKPDADAGTIDVIFQLFVHSTRKLLYVPLWSSRSSAGRNMLIYLLVGLRNINEVGPSCQHTRSVITLIMNIYAARPNYDQLGPDKTVILTKSHHDQPTTILALLHRRKLGPAGINIYISFGHLLADAELAENILS